MQKNRSPYETVAAFVTLSIVLYLIFPQKYWLFTGLGLGLLTLLFRPTAHWLDYLWLQISKVLNFVVTKVLLSVVFFVILVPIALLYRLSGKDSLQKKKLDGVGNSYFLTRNQGFSPKDFEKTW